MQIKDYVLRKNGINILRPHLIVFLRFLCDRLIPCSENPYEVMKLGTTKELQIKKATLYEEARLRAKLNAKPISEELKEEIFVRIVKPLFLKYLDEKLNE